MEMPNVKLYTAVKGGGAFCEGQKITPSETETLNESLWSQDLDMSTLKTGRGI